MAIVIQNLGTNRESTGSHDYQVRINHRVICDFSHIREHGLAECLRAAADAVEQAEARKMIAHFDLRPLCGGGK